MRANRWRELESALSQVSARLLLQKKTSSRPQLRAEIFCGEEIER